jgi:protein-tyrosine-phosphatase
VEAQPGIRCVKNLEKQYRIACFMDKILVVCRSNAGRSQIAQAFLRKYHHSAAIRSAGTNVRVEERDGYLLRQDIVDGGLSYGLDLAGSRRGQLREEDLDWADHVIVVMPLEELQALKSQQARNLKGHDVDAAHLADWSLKHESKVSFWPVADIRAAEAEKRTPQQVAEAYAEINRLALDWIRKSGLETS